MRHDATVSEHNKNKNKTVQVLSSEIRVVSDHRVLNTLLEKFPVAKKSSLVMDVEKVFCSAASPDIDEVACVLLQKRKVAKVHHDLSLGVKMRFPR